MNAVVTTVTETTASSSSSHQPSGGRLARIQLIHPNQKPKKFSLSSLSPLFQDPNKTKEPLDSTESLEKKQNKALDGISETASSSTTDANQEVSNNKQSLQPPPPPPQEEIRKAASNRPCQQPRLDKKGFRKIAKEKARFSDSSIKRLIDIGRTKAVFRKQDQSSPSPSNQEEPCSAEASRSQTREIGTQVSEDCIPVIATIYESRMRAMLAMALINAVEQRKSRTITTRDVHVALKHIKWPCIGSV